MIAALKSVGRWLWMVLLAAVAVTAVFRSRAAQDRAERAHGRVRDAAANEASDRWRKIDHHLNAATKAEARAEKRKADATKALDAISAGDSDLRDLLNRYNSRRVRDPADTPRLVR